jgi:hypothetical protein
MEQQHMRVPMYNDYSSQVLPQQAAAASQHPKLAPRPIDPATVGYQPFSSQMSSSNQAQPINAPPFHYSAASSQPPTHMWQPMAQAESTSIPSNTTNYSQTQQPVEYQTSTPPGPQANNQMRPQVTSPIGQTAEEYASNLSPMPSLNPVSMTRPLDIHSAPQVCISVINLFAADILITCFLDGPASADDISLSATARTITAAVTVS